MQSGRAVARKLTLKRQRLFFSLRCFKSHFIDLIATPTAAESFSTSCVGRCLPHSGPKINARHVFALYTLVSLVIALVVVFVAVAVVVVVVLCLWGTMSMASAELWHPGA